jgi:hypothetical protein
MKRPGCRTLVQKTKTGDNSNLLYHDIILTSFCIVSVMSLVVGVHFVCYKTVDDVIQCK